MLSEQSQVLAGILVLSLVTVETGGAYLLRIARGAAEVTPFQERFARAGHAHAGVLLVLSLALQPYADAAALEGALGWLARAGVPAAALLMPAGFFFCSMGSGRTSPNRLIALVVAGALLLAASLTTLGVGLLVR